MSEWYVVAGSGFATDGERLRALNMADTIDVDELRQLEEDWRAEWIRVQHEPARAARVSSELRVVAGAIKMIEKRDGAA